MPKKSSTSSRRRERRARAKRRSGSRPFSIRLKRGNTNSTRRCRIWGKRFRTIFGFPPAPILSDWRKSSPIWRPNSDGGKLLVEKGASPRPNRPLFVSAPIRYNNTKNPSTTDDAFLYYFGWKQGCRSHLQQDLGPGNL